ncbi:MAG: hypothetical protein M3019_02945 [Candidatus Dormibacteraeota bacterium]|nr:hypothetical protein [Candidatus Dormibacteraeota bacterium]
MAITTPLGAIRLPVTAGGRMRAGAVGDDLRNVRRALQLALAALWLLDAALQFQPYMFTTGFVTGTLAPAAQGNPSIVAGPMTWVLHVIAQHTAAFNALFATIQLLIGAGLFWRRSVKVALAASVGWAIAVWWFGEGLGGVLLGASPLMGAPGAVLLYALFALLIWPRREAGSVATSGALGGTGARIAWSILWGSLAYLFLLPPNRNPAGLRDVLAGAAAGEPGWLAAVNHHVAATLSGHGTELSIVLAVLCDLIAISIFVPRLARAGIAGALAVAGFIWVGEAFGGVFTGRGTDPNSGILLGLLAVAYWPLHAVSSNQRFGPANGGRATAERATTTRDRSVGLLAALSLLVTGSVAANASSADAPGFPGHSMASGMSMSAGPSGSGANPSSVGPSQSARMVCGSEIRTDVTTTLGLSTQPPATATWSDHLYTCTYRLSTGPLVIRVKELPDVQAAHRYFDGLRQRNGPTHIVTGLASLGLPGYETTTGTVIFLKDDKTLQVDATALPPQLGRDLVSQTEFAYQIATNILGCWTGK